MLSKASLGGWESYRPLCSTSSLGEYLTSTSWEKGTLEGDTLCPQASMAPSASIVEWGPQEKWGHLFILSPGANSPAHHRGPWIHGVRG